jgi:hypothetical protein
MTVAQPEGGVKFLSSVAPNVGSESSGRIYFNLAFQSATISFSDLLKIFDQRSGSLVTLFPDVKGLSA